jgi:hypothetical protein
MFTARTKRSFELAVEISLKSHSGFVGTEHLLLAILMDIESTAVTILRALRVNLEKMEEDLVQSIMGKYEEEARKDRVYDALAAGIAPNDEDAEALFGMTGEEALTSYKNFIAFKDNPMAVSNNSAVTGGIIGDVTADYMTGQVGPTNGVVQSYGTNSTIPVTDNTATTEYPETEPTTTDNPKTETTTDNPKTETTTDNPKTKTTDQPKTEPTDQPKTGEMSDSDTKNYVNGLSEKMETRYGSDSEETSSAITVNPDGTYNFGSASKSAIINEVAGDKSLTDEEVEYLLYDVFGFTQEEVEKGYNANYYTTSDIQNVAYYYKDGKDVSYIAGKTGLSKAEVEQIIKYYSGSPVWR